MSRYNEQHATTMLNALQGTDTLKQYEDRIRADERAKTLKQVMPILIEIVDKEGSCYGFEEEIDALEEEYLNSKEQKNE